MPSLDSAAHELARGVQAQWPESDLVRVLAQAVTDFSQTRTHDEQAAFLDRPSPTGDPVWDAALAALAVHLCRQASWERVPDWTREPDRYVTRLAWIGLPPDSDLQAYVFQRTPAYFKARGIMLNVENLVSV